ncbi:hypothetical protein TB1_032364 [Malus domestica]
MDLKKAPKSLKILCTYGQLMEKLKEFCGYSVELKCPLPNRDLETLIAVKFDEESMNIIEEYGRASSPPRPLKIKTILAPPKSPKQISPLMSTATSGGDSPLRLMSFR